MEIFMKEPSIGIAREGLPTIGIGALASGVFALLGWAVPAVLVLAFTAFSLWFFRDPQRIGPHPADEPNVGISPADGKIVDVGTAVDPVTGISCTRVCIFMNVFNVHVNRACVGGTVKAIRYWPGKFINASLDKASEDNERCAVNLTDTEGGSWTMVQIAGLIARRIVTRVEEGDSIGRGERFGMIKFGSRVDVYMPEGYVPEVSLGDKTLAGLTIIARKKAK